MVTAVVIFALLTVAASLASWLFGQWLAARTRISGAALAIGGGGVVALVGTVASVMFGASTGWQRLVPVQDSAPLIPPLASPVLAPPAATPADREAEILALAERRLEAVVIDADWSATSCVTATYSERTARWILDNACSGVVAVAFESCELGAGCRRGGWRYEPAGILMTAANDKPVLLRVAEKGPLVAPIFTIPDVAGTRRQIRYGACLVTAPRVLRLLRDSGSDQMAQQRLAAALSDDVCYSQVLRWSSGSKQLTKFSTGSQQ